MTREAALEKALREMLEATMDVSSTDDQKLMEAEGEARAALALPNDASQGGLGERLRVALAEAQKDSARLDWLDREGPDAIELGPDLRWGVFGADDFEHEADDLRAAIDAARAAEREEKS